MGLVGAFHADFDGIEAGHACLMQGKTGTGGVHLVQLHAPGADHAFKGGLSAGEVGADDAALSVGHGAEGQIGEIAGYEVAQNDYVAAGIDVGIGGLHVGVHQNAAARMAGDAGVGSDLGVGSHADGEDDFVGFYGALVGHHFAHVSVLALEFLHGFAGENRDAELFKVMLGHLAEVVAELGGQYMVYHFDDGNLDAPHVGESHGHFQAYEAGADDDGVIDLASGTLFLNGLGGFKAGNRGDVLQIGSGNGRNAGAAARGDDQLVVGHVALFAGLGVFDGNGFFLAVDGEGTRVADGVDALEFLEESFVSYHAGIRGAQTVHLGNVAAHEVGDAAAAVGDVGALVDHGDVAVGHETLGTGGSLGAERNAAYDEDIESHGKNLQR